MSHSYNGAENRGSLRVFKNYSLFFHYKDHPDKKSDETFTKDISKGGIRFTTSQPVKPGTYLVIKMGIPYIAPKRLVLEGLVITCDEITPRLVYEIRAKFESLDEETSQILEMIEKRNSKERKLMDCINIGLIGYGVVGQGVVKALKSRRKFLREKYETDFFIKTICDRSISKKPNPALENTVLTTDYNVILKDPDIHVVVELIGGLSPAKEIVLSALKAKKHVVTANKALIAECGLELFKEADANGCSILFESSVGAGIPIIRTITEGMAGNKFNGVYGIINGTCNYILTAMAKFKLTFAQALKEAQEKGYAESNPTLDISGMDAAYKLAILVFITMGKFVSVKDIYVEGINHISHEDIEFADSLDLSICLLAIAKKTGNKLDVRVHPTMIPKDHGLATVNGVDNAIFLDADPLGDVSIEGQGAGQMTAAMGVIADLINLGIRVDAPAVIWAFNPADEVENLTLRKIDEIETRFYIRFMVIDKPGVLASITTVLGQHSISIASVNQKQENKGSTVPVVILTHQANEHEVKEALVKINELAVVKGKPVAIRMEKL